MSVFIFLCLFVLFSFFVTELGDTQEEADSVRKSSVFWQSLVIHSKQLRKSYVFWQSLLAYRNNLTEKVSCLLAEHGDPQETADRKILCLLAELGNR